MRLLVDTNILLFLTIWPDKITNPVREALVGAEEVFISPLSRAEIGVKMSIGKLHLPMSEPVFWDETFSRLQASSLPFDERHASRMASAPLHHRDPFDRMMVAQCMEEELTLVTSDLFLRAYEISLII